MPEDYLRDLWTAPVTPTRKAALDFAAETEGLAATLPWNWLTRISPEDHRMLFDLGISLKC